MCEQDGCTYGAGGNQANHDLHSRSGHIESPDRLVAFLYDLLRDHLPAGEVEKLVRDAEVVSPENIAVYTNGYLARYAKDLADRLR